MRPTKRRRITLLALGLAWAALMAIAENPSGSEFIHRLARRALAGTDAIDPFFLCQRFFGGMRGDYDAQIVVRKPGIERPPQGITLAIQTLLKGVMVTVDGVREGGWPAFLPALLSLVPGLLISGTIVGAALGPDSKRMERLTDFTGVAGYLLVILAFLSLMVLIGGTIALALKWTLHGVFWALGASATLVVYASPLILAIEKVWGLVETGGKVRELATLVATADPPAEATTAAGGGASAPAPGATTGA
jgi:hypothetical protein